MADSLQNQLRDRLFGRDGLTAYAVLDGASIPDLREALFDFEPEHQCLYRGELAPDIESVAPYLVRMKENEPFTQRVLTEGWGQHWGIFAVVPSDVSFPEIRKHFRTFLMVKTAEGKSLYFRYYDPRVLQAYLPTCSPAELATMYGPIEAYMAEGRRGESLVMMSRKNNELIVERLEAAVAAAGA